jgi:hypothetical protein
MVQESPHMSNTTTIGLSIVPPTIAHFKWVWDSNHWDPLLFHFLLVPHRQILPLVILRLTKPPDSFNRFITSTNRSKRFCRNPMLSTRNDMINIGYHTSFRLVINSGYFSEGVSHWAPSEASSPSLWALHYHQGCG